MILFCIFLPFLHIWFFFSGFDQPKVSSESAISPSAATAQDTLQQLVISSKSNGANFLKSTLPALTNKLQRMVTSPIEEVHQPTINNSRPPLSDKEFRSFLDNVGELVNKTFLLDSRLDSFAEKKIVKNSVKLTHFCK